MESKSELNRISKKSIYCWQISMGITSLFIIGGVIGAYFLWFQVWQMFFLVPLLVASAILVPIVQYKRWEYIIAEDRVEMRYGLISVKHTLIPISRIQHLRISQGILQKQFHISSIMIFTAAGTESIHGVHQEEAERIIQNLNTIIGSEECEQDA